MICVNNGMAKSASTLLSHYTILLLRRCYLSNGIEALRSATEDGRLKGVSFFVESLDARTLPVLEALAEAEGPLLVKIHAPAHDFLLQAIQAGRIRMTTTFRDPRDVILSAIDHARRSRGQPNAVFQEFTTVEASVEPVRWWGEMALGWLRSRQSLMVRYEDLLTDPTRELTRLAEHYGIPATPTDLEAVVAQEQGTRKASVNQFNKGLLSRFRDEMTPAQIAHCSATLGDQIKALGYAL
ncbi:MAG: sulfotransferase domain-containing protein [Opitutales bacterium]